MKIELVRYNIGVKSIYTCSLSNYKIINTAFQHLNKQDLLSHILRDFTKLNMDINMKLRKSGNEIDGMFVSYETDDVKSYTRNNTMFHKTVNYSFPDEIVISTLQGERTYKLTTAPTKEPKTSKSGKSNGEKSNGDKNIQKPIDDTVCYKPHDGSTGKITFVKSGGISRL